MKAEVARRTAQFGIPENRLFLSATHTHSAPDPLHLHSANTGPSKGLATYDEKLAVFMADKIALSIQTAFQQLEVANVATGQMQGIKLNRNRRGEGLTDDEMTCIRLITPGGKIISSIFVYAAHPVYFGSENLQVSGDWSGAFTRQLEAVIPGATILFLNGAEGDASPNGSDEGTSPDKIVTYAAKLGEKAWTLMEQATPVKVPELKMWSHFVAMPNRQPHPLFLLASAMLKSTPAQARELVDRVMPEKVEVTYLSIGDALLIGVTGEPTTPIGLATKSASRASGFPHPAIVALTNGWIGYIVTADQYKAGKYEPTMSFYGPTIGAVVLAGIEEGLKVKH